MLRRNILAADDSTLVLDSLDSLFSRFHRVIHARNGAIALTLARELRPHLIITLANGSEPLVALNKSDDLDVLVSTVSRLFDTQP